MQARRTGKRAHMPHGVGEGCCYCCCCCDTWHAPRLLDASCSRNSSTTNSRHGQFEAQHVALHLKLGANPDGLCAVAKLDRRLGACWSTAARGIVCGTQQWHTRHYLRLSQQPPRVAGGRDRRAAAACRLWSQAGGVGGVGSSNPQPPPPPCACTHLGRTRASGARPPAIAAPAPCRRARARWRLPARAAQLIG